jgi:hypothetical protein
VNGAGVGLSWIGFAIVFFFSFAASNGLGFRFGLVWLLTLTLSLEMWQSLTNIFYCSGPWPDFRVEMRVFDVCWLFCSSTLDALTCSTDRAQHCPMGRS